MATNWYRDRQQAEALQRSLERYEAMLKDRISPEQAAPLAVTGLDPALRRLFSLSVTVSAAAAPIPEPTFAVSFEERLRAARVRRLDERRRRRTPGFATLAAAACVALLAGLLFAASGSLPGDRLYAVKRFGETAQVALASGPAEARMRLAFASKRLNEVEGLIDRSHGQVIGVQGSAIAAAAEAPDPEIAKLILDTLAEAQRQISTAAEILIEDRSDAESLGKVVDLAHKGITIANAFVQELPETDQPPILATAVTLAEVEEQAQEALDQIPPTPTPGPCATPSPTPEPESSAAATATPDKTSSPTPSASPEATERAEATPSSTPCTSPTPEATPTAGASPAPETSTGASPAPSGQPSDA